MADLLLELFSEEIPARMQTQAGKDLERLVVGALSDRGLLFEGAKAFAGPRRLTLVCAGLPVKQPDVREERKGPRVGAPDKAIEGFLRSAGVTLEQCQKQNDGKGEFYVAVIERQGRATAEVLAEILPECFAKLPWPKSMRWRAGEAVRWVRPLHSILCTFDGEVVPFEFAGVTSGNETRGHRFLSSGPIAVKRFEDYAAKLRAAHVMLDVVERKDTILNDARNKAFALGLELIEDEGLLDEVAGLNEWPTVLIGTIEDQFMDVPAEILQTSMRTHQKYFSVRASFAAPPSASSGGAPQDDESGDAKGGGVEKSRHAEVRAEGEPRSIANRFVVVSNMVAEDGGKQIVAGNERVLRARLSDAKFFWDQDRQHRLDSRVEALKGITFHAKLGTQYERVERIEALAGEIAAKIGADVEKARRAARLCKADLTTGVVGEFPELQGIMGSYYAAHDGEDADVVAAIREHYKPLGPGDAVPTNNVSIAVALADKLNQLVELFWVGEIPKGSGDPYALRRAALGVIRICLENQLRLSLSHLCKFSMWDRIYRWDQSYNSVLLLGSMEQKEPEDAAEIAEPEFVRPFKHVRSPDDLEEFRLYLPYDQICFVEGDLKGIELDEFASFFDDKLVGYRDPIINVETLRIFFADRLKVALKEKGTRHDLIDAVFSLGNEDDLVRLVARVEALQSFLKTENGAHLLAASKRATNIVRIEQKKYDTVFEGAVDPTYLREPEARTLLVALSDAESKVVGCLDAEDYIGAMTVLAGLRDAVDAFFENVRVNDDNSAVRENKLRLLTRLWSTLNLVADFSKIEG